ncbi:hypothetical protein FWC63_02695 [Candidatus Saccharibacteria bacterium]|nr:hypothetical protein [Candidatus Saccharibacteria bacterium]
MTKQTTKTKTWRSALVELGLAISTVAVALLIGTTVSADGPSWGPQDRPTFTMQNPAPRAVWNSIIDQTILPPVANGDERNFIWVREFGVGEFQNTLAIQGGRQYEVMMYFHNNAADNLNREDPRNAIMFRARTRVILPDTLEAQEVGIIRAYLMADNADTVWDEVWIISNEAVEIAFVPGSARLFNNSNRMHDGSGRVLPSSLFSASGTLIGWHDLDGVLPGCTYYSGWIRFVFNTVAIEEYKPIPPQPPEEPGDGPEELPETGPVEVVGVMVGTTLLVIAVVYYVRSRRSIDQTV